jgi:hypothetical protein
MIHEEQKDYKENRKRNGEYRNIKTGRYKNRIK